MIIAACGSPQTTTEFIPTDVAKARGLTIDSGGAPLDSIRVMLRIPATGSAVYDMPTLVTGKDGRFELTVHRVSGSSLLSPDTVSGWVVGYALSPKYPELPDGRLFSDSTRVLLTFVPTSSEPHVANVAVTLRR